MKNLMYGVIGTIITFGVFIIIANLLNASDASSLVLIGISIIAGVIFFCTRLILEKIEEINISSSKEYSDETKESLEEK